MAQTYTKTDLGVLVAGEWALVEGRGAECKLGEGVVATLRESPDPVWNHPHDVTLPFPFTLEQFRAFCAWHPTFEWEAIESQFTNDDGSLDEIALGELEKRGTAAAELVRRFLTGDTDAPEATAQQGVPKRNEVESACANVETVNSALSNIVWTPKRLAEVAAFRERHGTRKAAQHFGVSEQLIRRKLPKKPSPPRGYSVFVHRTK